MSLEVTIVVALARTVPSDEDKRSARAIAGGELDWEAVRSLAHQWCVEPVVAMNLRVHLADILSADRRDWIKAWEQSARAAALAQAMLLARISVAMGKSAIDVIALKGPALAMVAYNDFSLRTSLDIDLVVRPKDIGAAAATLRAMRYEPGFDPQMTSRLIKGGHALEFYGESSQVELHSSLLPRHLHLNFSDDDVWGSSETVFCMGSEIRTLSPPVHFLYLCAHGAKHLWQMPRWTCDISELGERLNPNERSSVLQLAEKYRALRLLALALRVVRDTFGDSRLQFPPEALGNEAEIGKLANVARVELERGAVEGQQESSQSLSRIHPYARPLLYWLQCRESWLDKLLGIIRFAVVPTPDDPVGILAGPLRPVRSVARVLRRNRSQ